MQDITPRDKQRFRCVIDASIEPNQSNDWVHTDLTALSHVDWHEDLYLPRVQALSRILRMAADNAWSLRRLDKQRIAGTFHYVSKRQCDNLSGIEWTILRNAAIELLEHDCRAELEMYNEFCELRRGEKPAPFTIESRDDWLRYKREALERPSRRRFLGMRRTKMRRMDH